MASATDVERSRETSVSAQIFEAAVFLIAQRESLGRREYACHHATPEAANSEAGWFFRGKDDKFDGTPRLVSHLLQNADCLKPTQHAHASVV